MSALCYIDWFAVQGIEATEPHRSGKRARCGVKILDLVGHKASALEVERKFQCGGQIGSGVTRNKIRHQVLFFAHFGIEFGIFFGKSLKGLVRRLTHQGKDVGRHMFWRDFKLTRHMILHKLTQKRVVRVEHGIVKTHTRAHKHFLYSWNLAQFAQELDIIAVVGLQIGTRLGRKAAAVHAGTVLGHFAARGHAEIGGGPAHVVDVAPKVGEASEFTRLFYDGGAAAGADVPALMEGEGAEGAGAEAAARRGEGEFDFGKGGHTAKSVVGRMPLALVGERIDSIHFLLRKGQRRALLNDDALSVRLDKRRGRKWIGVLVLQRERLRVSPFGKLVGTVECRTIESGTVKSGKIGQHKGVVQIRPLCQD